MFRLFECCALSFFERFVLSFSLKIERFVSDSAEIWICGLYVSMWEAANHYRYSFTLTGGGYIVFDPPTVNAWSDAIGGNVTIDVTQ